MPRLSNILFRLLFVSLFFPGMDFTFSALVNGSETKNEQQSGHFYLSRFKPHRDGKTDDTSAFQECFNAAARQGGGIVQIEPGDYFLTGEERILLSSHLTIRAHGARFFLPKKLENPCHRDFFYGLDIVNLTWEGGDFRGYCFDPGQKENCWEPNVSTRIIVIETSEQGTTSDLTFRDLRSNGIGGAVVSVFGSCDSNRKTINPATEINIRDCILLRSGRFMWDYGFLWQHIVWPEYYEAWEVERAQKYFWNDLIRSEVRMKKGESLIRFAPGDKPIVGPVCFYGEGLPENIIRGRNYYPVEIGRDSLVIAKEEGGPPLIFASDAGPGVKMIVDTVKVFKRSYDPIGFQPGKGAIDLCNCKNIIFTGCQLSALGDTMHIYRSENIVFSNNQILGSRMGAFFIAQFCKNATVTGNTVNGTNGSRVMSIETCSRDITVVGNTFINGGRGSWINQPTNLILKGNLFIDNTTKGEKNPRRGRRSIQTGDWESYPELYFTLSEKDGSYGSVIVKDNLFRCSDSCSENVITFEKNGDGIYVDGNVFSGKKTKIEVDPSCTNVFIEGQEINARTGKENARAAR